MYTFLRKVAPNLVDNAHVSQPLNEQPNRERETRTSHSVGVVMMLESNEMRDTQWLVGSSSSTGPADKSRESILNVRPPIFNARLDVALQGRVKPPWPSGAAPGIAAWIFLASPSGREDVRRARVENASAMPEPHVDVVERECVDVALPEADLRYVGDGDEGRGIVLGGVHAAKGDRPIMFAISDAGDLV